MCAEDFRKLSGATKILRFGVEEECEVQTLGFCKRSIGKIEPVCEREVFFCPNSVDLAGYTLLFDADTASSSSSNPLGSYVSQGI